MVRAATPLLLPDEEDALSSEARQSGTRRVAHEAKPDGRRASERPTLPVPGAASLVGYIESPPRIQRIAIEGSSRGSLKPSTLRVRLTPYAREHACADGDTDDTPGAMLEYLRLLGPLDRVPCVAATMESILVAKLDHREGFVLSLVDGRSDIESLIDACPMPTHKTLRILLVLRARGLIAVRNASP
jgi:hypothetical protein